MVLGCTEDNPFQGTATEGEETSAGPSSGGDPTTVGTSVTTSAQTSAEGTASATEADTTMGPTTDDPSATDTVDPTDPSSTGEPTCASSCVALPPGDWEGPAAVLHDAPDDPDPLCVGDFDELGTTAFANLDAAAASCDCDCADPVGAACSHANLETDNNSGCPSPSATNWNITAACNDSVDSAMSQFWQATAVIDSGSCAEIELFEIPDVSFVDRYSACAASVIDSGGCEPGTACVPMPQAPYDGRTCIWHDGDLQCPRGIGYDTRTVYYRDVADDRGCEACSCGDVEGTCSGGVNLFQPDACGGWLLAGAVTANGGCVQVADDIHSARLSGAGLTPSVSANCEPSASSPIGAAESIDPITFCCDS
jgi:hypothetical protein